MSYSVAIRTLGQSGEKYRKLLKSIENSELSPEKVIVILPEGCGIPSDRLGYEEFHFCKKGMISQRMEALSYIDSEYTFFVDDDIEFGPDFTCRLLKPLEERLYDCSTGPLFSFFPKSIPGKVTGFLTASVSPAVVRRDKYVRLLRSGGWSYNRIDTSKHRYYPTESFAWTCFMIRTDTAKSIDMKKAAWWVGVFGYDYGDDRVFACELERNGYKACIVSDAFYIHNDAGTSIGNEYRRKFCTYYFQYVFWHKYIKVRKGIFNRILNRICFEYSSFMLFLYCLIKSFRKPYYIKAFVKGRQAGKGLISSEKETNIDSVYG